MNKIIYDGWHKIEEVEVEIKGKMVKRELLHLKSAVAGIVTDKSDRIALVSQFRPALNKQILEIPAGVVDKDLSNIDILKEELLEECYINPEDVIAIESTNPKGYHMVSGSSPAFLNLYRVRVKCEKEPLYLVDDPDVDYVIWIGFEEFEEMVMNGEILDSKTLFAYFILKGEQ